MERILRVRQLPLLVIAALAVAVALAGVALGGSSPPTTKKVKKIVKQEVTKLAPGLSVANANTAGNAASADNAGKVDGADVCSGTTTIQTNATTTVCTAGALSIQAVCQIAAGTTKARLDLSGPADAWAFGERMDPPATEAAIAEVFLPSPYTLAEGSDTNASSAVADGSGAWVSSGTSGGASLNGEFSAWANHTNTSQGTCLFSIGGVAR